MRLRVGHQHSQFWPILACFMDYYSLFWGPGLISTSNEPCRAFTCRYQHSQFWPILTRFVDYYSLFWGPGVISTINEPLSAFTCQSSIILGLSDSGLFHGLLLTILGSQNAFHGCRTPRCAYVSVINNRSFGRFWPVSWTITQFLAHVVISTTDEHRCVYVSVINI